VFDRLPRWVVAVELALVGLLEDGGGLCHRIVAAGLLLFGQEGVGPGLDAFSIVSHPSSVTDGQVCNDGVSGYRAKTRREDDPDEEVRMPPRAWSDQRERQYEHIEQGLEERGRSEDTAKEIAARTVNKERARAGEADTASRSSLADISSERRGGLRSHSGPGGRTKEQLYNEARRKGIKGRSKMNKRELEEAVGR
jgi:hypothetical protein